MTKRYAISIIFFFLVCCTATSNKDKASEIDSSEIVKSISSSEKGKKIFTKFCNSCHHTPESHVTDQLVFDKLFERLPTPQENYFMKYIRDGKALKESGDKYAITVSKEWNSNYNHQFKDSLSIENTNDLIVYIKSSFGSKSH